MRVPLTGTGTSLAGLCTEYFDRFSTKMCCFDDLRPYLAALTAEECVPLQDKFRIVSEASWVLVSIPRRSLSLTLPSVAEGDPAIDQRAQGGTSDNFRAPDRVDGGGCR